MAAYELVRRGIPVTMLETGDDVRRGTLVRMAEEISMRIFRP